MSQRPIIVSPLSETKQQQVIEKTQSYFDMANELFGVNKEEVKISFDLKGRAAGMYRVTRRLGFCKREIRYNTFIFSKYYDDNLNNTIPHEVAHYVSDLIYGLKNIKPHGKEWKAVMHAFGADDSVTADYDLSGIPLKKQSLYTYQCSCREHQLTSIRHNKINKKRFQYYCNTCKKKLSLKQEDQTLI